MGKTRRRQRNGTGPKRDSYQDRKFGTGKRKRAGEKCPKVKPA